MAESVLSLDYTAIDAIETRTMTKVRNYPDGLARIIGALKSEVKAEARKAKQISKSFSRLKREVLIAKHRDYIGLCNTNLERLYMSKEDNHELVVTFYESRERYGFLVASFVQIQEETMSTQKDKLLMRLKGFSKTIVDNMHDATTQHDKLRTTLNSIAYKLDVLSKNLVSAHIVPEIWRIAEFFEHIREPIILVKMLQFLEVLYDHSLKLVNGKENAKALQDLVLFSSRTVAVAFQQLRALSLDTDCLVVVLHLTFSVLRSLLRMKAALAAYFNELPEEDDEKLIESRPSSGKYRRPLSASDPRSVDYSRECVFLGGSWSNSYSTQDLATDFVLWAKVILQAKSGKFDCRELYCRYGSAFRSFFHETSASSSLPSGLTPAAVLRELITSELPRYLAIGSALLETVLAGADELAEVLYADPSGWGEPALTIIPLSNAGEADSSCGSNGSSGGSGSSSGNSSGVKDANASDVTVFGSIAHEVLLVSLELGRAVASKYAVRLGEMGGINCVVSGDLTFYKHADAECLAAFNVASRAFGLMLLEDGALDILSHGFTLCITRSPSFNLMVSFLKLCLAASLCALQCRPSDPRDLKDGFASLRGRIDTQLAAQDRRLEVRRPASAASRPSSGRPPSTSASSYASSSSSASVLASAMPPTSILSRPGTIASDKDNIRNSNQGSRITFAAKNDYNSVVGAADSIGFGDDYDDDDDDEEEDGIYLSDEVIAAKNAAKETARLQALVEVENARIQAALEAAEEAMEIAMSRPKAMPLRYMTVTRESVCQMIASNAVKVMVVMTVHRSSLVTSHTGLLVIRLLLRESILSKLGFEELLHSDLLTYVQPLNEQAGDLDEDDNEVDEQYEEMMRQLAEKDAKKSDTSSQSSVASSAPSSPTKGGSIGGGSSKGSSSGDEGDDAASASSKPKKEEEGQEARFKAWKTKHVNAIFNDGVVSKAEYTFTDLLTWLGESHIQCDVVMEQLLLLIEHMTHYSDVSKYAMMGSGMVEVIRRFLSVQTNNLYAIALGEICFELLDT